jgi:hypothetical protein
MVLRALSSSGRALSPRLAPARSRVTVSRRRPGGIAVIAASITVRWSAVLSGPALPLARHRGRRPGGVIAVGRQRSLAGPWKPGSGDEEAGHDPP